MLKLKAEKKAKKLGLNVELSEPEDAPGQEGAAAEDAPGDAPQAAPDDAPQDDPQEE
jgi:hypothetical protein